MSFQLMAWAVEQTVGSSTRKAVLLALANAANHHTGKCCPSIPRIAAETEYGETAVKQALKALCEAGLIERSRPRRADGSLGAYEYRFPKAGAAQPQAGAASRATGGSRPSEPRREDLEPVRETEPSALPPMAEGGSRRIGSVDRRPTSDEETTLAWAILDAWNELTVQTLRSVDWARKIVMRIRERPELGIEEHRQVIEAALRPEGRWWKGDPSPSVIYGNGAIFERALMGAAKQAVPESQRIFEIALAAIEEARREQ